MSDRSNSTVEYTKSSLGVAIPVPTLRVLREGARLVMDRWVRFLDDPGQVPIGRAVPAAGISLEDDKASRSHATVALTEGELTLVDTSTNGTFLNGRRIGRIAPLADGDVIRVGTSFLLVRYAMRDGQDAEVDGLTGDAPAIRDLRRALVAVAPTPATVLILGESGTGKELVARSVHDLSGRAGPFVAVNCSAISESLAESLLFGHVAGAFTGAHGANPGYFAAAAGGTLFLDELADLPAHIQPKLLRVLEDREVMPLGASRTRPVDVRIVAATNQELSAAVERGAFRGDLYARVAEITLRTPPLRSRREDILPFLARELGPRTPPMSTRLCEALLLHPWPFNVRELRKIAVQLRIHGAMAARLDLSMIEDRIAPPDVGPAPVPDPHAAGRNRRASTGPPAPDSLYEWRTPGRPAGDGSGPAVPGSVPGPGGPAAASGAGSGGDDQAGMPPRDVLEGLLRGARGNITRVAHALGRSRRQVYRYLEAHGIDLDRYR